jgi:hypothetical protein
MTEAQLQAKCIQYAWNNYPQSRGLIYANYNNPKNAGHGAHLKAIGLVKGVADITILWNGQAHFVELKAEDGRQSKAQKEWQDKVNAAGFNYHLIRTFETWEKLLKMIMG